MFSFYCPATHIFDDSDFSNDEFRMYGYKILQCPNTRAHEWTQCPFAHNGEKARRRDPRRFNYAAITCPDFKNGECRKGDGCPLAHGVFEYWLHPGKYRTRPCNAGSLCKRKVCFFAHSPEELRRETMYKPHSEVRPGNLFSGSGSGDGPTGSARVGTHASGRIEGSAAEFLRQLRSLKLRGDGEEKPGNSGRGGSGSEDPDLDWVMELVD